MEGEINRRSFGSNHRLCKIQQARGGFVLSLWAVFIDDVRNGVFDGRRGLGEERDRRFPTSYRGLDYSEKMMDVQKGRVQIWFGNKAKIPFLP